MYWIFDLDYTLYDIPRHLEFDYVHLKKNAELKENINKLPDKKGIFTNGTLMHAYNGLIALGLEDVFHFIDARDSLHGLKPDKDVYLRLLNKNKIDRQEKIIFFDDSVDNLKMGKFLGWITVHIHSLENPIIFREQYIDFTFNTIEDAVNFFNHHLHD